MPQTPPRLPRLAPTRAKTLLNLTGGCVSTTCTTVAAPDRSGGNVFGRHQGPQSTRGLKAFFMACFREAPSVSMSGCTYSTILVSTMSSLLLDDARPLPWSPALVSEQLIACLLLGFARSKINVSTSPPRTPLFWMLNRARQHEQQAPKVGLRTGGWRERSGRRWWGSKVKEDYLQERSRKGYSRGSQTFPVGGATDPQLRRQEE